MVRALITGISGQDGSFLVDRLHQYNWEIHALVRHSTNGSDIVNHTGDLADRQSIADCIRACKPDVVFNLGAVSSVAASWTDPVGVSEVNGLAVTTILEEALRLQADFGHSVRVIQASSSEIFGQASVYPQDETTPVNPISPYGAAKAYAHHMVGVYRSRGLHASSAILYNHESTRRPLSFVTRKITNTVARIAFGEESKLVLGNLSARRDWGWAPDYVDALLKMSQAPDADDYVIATGKSHSIRDFVAEAFNSVGIEDWERFVETDPKFFRPADTGEMLGNASKAKHSLSWSPTTHFPEIVSSMVRADIKLLSDEGKPRGEVYK